MGDSTTCNLLVVVLNFRTPKLTIGCLRSLEKQVERIPGTHVVVVENGSRDDSAERIASAIDEHLWGEWASLRVSETNLGFAGGILWGTRHAPRARYLLLLNSDTIVHSGCLRYCFDLMERDKTIGAMDCLVKNADGSVQNTTRKFPTPLRATVSATGMPWKWPRAFGWADIDEPTWDRGKEKRDVEWIGGAFLFVRGELWYQLGGLDDEFFFYGEDVEFSHRVWGAGYRCHHDPAVCVTHAGGGSSRTDNRTRSALRLSYWRGRYLVQRKCYGVVASWWLRGVDIVVHFLRSIRMTCRGGGHSPRAAALRSDLKILLRPLR